MSKETNTVINVNIDGVGKYLMEIDKNFFQSNRKLFANILYKLNRIFTCKEILDYDIARNYLSSYSNMPIGSCWNRNNTYIQYDLQVIVPAYNVEKYIVGQGTVLCPSSTKSIKYLLKDGTI